VIFEGSLAKLDELNLYNNELSGTIPEELYYLKRLRFLKIAKNNLEGSLASAIGNSTHLVELEVGYNSLTGTLPLEMENMAFLELLSISNNTFQGPIPTFLGQMEHLSHLYLQYSGLTGPIPETFCNGTPRRKRKIVVDCEITAPLCSCCDTSDANATVKVECYKDSPWIKDLN
jgi:hypothetical protein